MNHQMAMDDFDGTGADISPFQVLFILGLPPPTSRPSLQAALQYEAERYRDLLQGAFTDTYRNLTLKALMAFNVRLR